LPPKIKTQLLNSEMVMGNQSVRIQMSSQTRLTLESLAEKYGCLYGGKPHVSGLLAQLADGRLVLSQVTSSQPYFSCLPLLKLRLWFPEGLRGSFAQVADRIANQGGNIIRVSMDTGIDSATAEVLLSIAEGSDLGALITALQEIRIQDVLPFNKEEEILAALDQTRKLSYSLYKEQESDLQRKKTFEERLLSSIINQKLLLDISCTIGLRVIARNQVGTLAKVTYEIAEQGFFVSQVKQDFDSFDGKDIIELLLTLRPKLQAELPQEIHKINTIVITLERIPAVKAVQRLGIDYL
jgi:uncharacterized protein with ACT and thioredoxin-like domain